VELPEDTVAVPTVLPPDVQVVGGEDSGPKTVKVMVPVGLDPEARAAEMEAAAMAPPSVPVLGPLADKIGLAFTVTAQVRAMFPAHPA
jgi:hypothetical protein